MIGRLRTLSPPLRYAVYVAGMVVLFFLAVGVGALAAFVADRQLGGAPGGSASNGTPEGGTLETTGARTLEGTTVEPSTGSRATPDTVSFVHRATDENSRGDYTYISDPSIDGDPDAIVLASEQGDDAAATYEHNIGVWYASGADKWAIFNQDRTPVPAGTTFEVLIPQASRFVHSADVLNTAGHYTFLDDRLTNGKPDAVLSVTQNWNPGGGRGVYNNHPVDTQYDAKLQKWAVYNLDGAPMPAGAAFNVAVSADDGSGG